MQQQQQVHNTMPCHAMQPRHTINNSLAAAADAANAHTENTASLILRSTENLVEIVMDKTKRNETDEKSQVDENYSMCTMN